MATKKIVITERSEDAIATDTPPVDKPTEMVEEKPVEEAEGNTETEDQVDEPAKQAEPPVDASQVAPHQPSDSQPDSYEPSISRPNPIRPSADPALESRRQVKVKALMRSYRRPRFSSLKSIRLKRKRVIAALCLVVVVAIAMTSLLSKPSNPLPASVKQKAAFSVYYPSNGSGYTYLTGSSSYTGGKLMYSLGPKGSPAGSGGPFIRVSEQALTGKGPDLKSLPSFSVFKVPAGEAAVGPDGEVLNGVVVTKKTLVILNGLGGVSRQDFIQVIEKI